MRGARARAEIRQAKFPDSEIPLHFSQDGEWPARLEEFLFASVGNFAARRHGRQD